MSTTVARPRRPAAELPAPRPDRYKWVPVDFSYWAFASLLLLMGLAMGLFSAPNQMGIMNSLPAHRRGVGSGMAATFQNSRWCSRSASSSRS